MKSKITKYMTVISLIIIPIVSFLMITYKPEKQKNDTYPTTNNQSTNVTKISIEEPQLRFNGLYLFPDFVNINKCNVTYQSPVNTSDWRKSQIVDYAEYTCLEQIYLNMDIYNQAYYYGNVDAKNISYKYTCETPFGEFKSSDADVINVEETGSHHNLENEYINIHSNFQYFPNGCNGSSMYDIKVDKILSAAHAGGTCNVAWHHMIISLIDNVINNITPMPLPIIKISCNLTFYSEEPKEEIKSSFVVNVIKD